jgi:outer membrane lipoprotein-sorting protein
MTSLQKHGLQFQPGFTMMIFFMVCILLPALGQSGPEYSATELLDRAERALYPDTFYMRSTMTTFRSTRRDVSMTFETYYRRDAGSFMEVLEPARTRGMRFLEKEGDIWLFNPRAGTRRAVRLSPRDSFQGSAFSNHDVSEPMFEEDYDVAISGQEILSHDTLGSLETIVLELTAKRDQAPYGKIVMWIRSTDYVPVYLEYYARSGLLFKRMTLEQLEELGGRVRPKIMRMESLEEEGLYSVIEIHHLEERTDLADRLFSQANLTR